MKDLFMSQSPRRCSFEKSQSQSKRVIVDRVSAITATSQPVLHIWHTLRDIWNSVCKHINPMFSVQPTTDPSNPYPPGQNGHHSGRRHSQMHFLEWTWSDSNFTEICSQGSNWQHASIGLDSGLAPNSRQAIIWTNADPIHWHIYAALGGDELRKRENTFKLHLRAPY